MVGPLASVCGVCARPVLLGVLPGPRCVRELRLSLAPSSVLPCPVLWFSVASTTLLRVWGCLGYPALLSAGWGFVPRSVAPSYQLVLTEAAGLGGVLGSLHCAPLAVGPLPGPPALLCLRSAGCFLGLEPSPSGEAAASVWRFSWRPVAAGALAVILPEAASQWEFFPLCLALPLQGSVPFLAFVSQLEALSESLSRSIPRSFLVVALWALLTLSGFVLFVPSAVLCVGLVDRSCRIVTPLALCLCWRFPSLVRV